MDAMWTLLRDWDSYASAGLAERSVQSYRYWILRFLAASLKDPLEATLDDLVAFLTSIDARGTARSMARRSLRHFFSWMSASGRRPNDPSELLPKARQHQAVPSHLEADEVAALIAAATRRDEALKIRWNGNGADHAWTPDWGASIALIYGTGARVGEACAIVPADVNLRENTVVFRKTKTGVERLVHLGPTARRAAQELLHYKRSTLLGIKPGAMRDRMKVSARLAGLPPRFVHPHVLRHSAATHLLQRGATIAEVQTFLGHSDVRMTMHYQHVASPRAKEVAELL